MDAIETVALARLVTDGAAREASGALAPGRYPVDLLVRVTGTFTRGDDYEQRIVAKADPWVLLGVALSKLNGVTVDALVREALAADEATAKAIKGQADAAMAAVKAPTATRCNGKITAALVVEAVGGSARVAA